MIGKCGEPDDDSVRLECGNSVAEYFDSIRRNGGANRSVQLIERLAARLRNCCDVPFYRLSAFFERLVDLRRVVLAFIRRPPIR